MGPCFEPALAGSLLWVSKMLTALLTGLTIALVEACWDLTAARRPARSVTQLLQPLGVARRALPTLKMRLSTCSKPSLTAPSIASERSTSSDVRLPSWSVW